MGIFIGVTWGMRGWFAVLYDTEEGPIQTGIGSYKTQTLARQEAIDWANAEGYELEPGFLDSENKDVIKK